ncbi:MAG: radical SAM protein [Bacteroidales bacterium]|nr:radical SAM protein [Bacteroidales bacterium]
MTTPYAVDKALRHPDRLALLRAGQQPYPVHVQLILSDFCNQNCTFCAYRTENYPSNTLFKVVRPDGSTDHNPRRMIPANKVREIIEDCRTMQVRAVQLTGGGEPTLHPEFDATVAKLLESGIDVGVVTNGLLMPTHRAELLAHCTWVRISVDAADRATYAAVRRVAPAQFDVVADHIQRLCSWPQRRATVGVGFVVTEQNYTGVREACQRYKSWGVDNVRVSAAFQNAGAHYFERFHDQVLDDVTLASSLNDDRFRVFDNYSSRYADLAAGTPDYESCGYMHFTTYIGGDQVVYTCCVNAYHPRGRIGSLANQSFRELWESSAKHTLFATFDARTCVRCMYNDKNHAITQAVQAAHGHENFV